MPALGADSFLLRLTSQTKRSPTDLSQQLRTCRVSLGPSYETAAQPTTTIEPVHVSMFAAKRVLEYKLRTCQ